MQNQEQEQAPERAQETQQEHEQKACAGARAKALKSSKVTVEIENTLILKHFPSFYSGGGGPRFNIRGKGLVALVVVVVVVAVVVVVVVVVSGFQEFFVVWKSDRFANSVSMPDRGLQA